MSHSAQVKALYFDVFGTVADWHTQVVTEGTLLSRRHGKTVPWGKFALRWRIDGYIAALIKIVTGEARLIPTEQIHRQKLDELLSEYGLTGLSEDEIADFNRVWNRIRQWPDVIAGLDALKQHYVIMPFSNGDLRCLTEISKNSGLPWDAIISADFFKKVKPDPSIYQDAANLMQLAPNQIMMVACHAQDLMAAMKCGMRTAYVARPLEYGSGNQSDEKLASFDYHVASFIELANALNTDREAV